MIFELTERQVDLETTLFRIGSAVPWPLGDYRLKKLRPLSRPLDLLDHCRRRTCRLVICFEHPLPSETFDMISVQAPGQRGRSLSCSACQIRTDDLLVMSKAR